MAETTLMRIGIFGGTFSPPHTGHLIVAQHVCEKLKLDRVFFVPSYISPHKRKGEEELAMHRLKMVQLAIKDNPLFAVSNEELTRKGNSYTVDTLVAFGKRFPESDLFLMIGADNYSDFHTWRNPGRILDLATLVVMNRPHAKIVSAKKLGPRKTLFVTVPDIEISSSTIRKMVRKGSRITYLVPSAVTLYIKRHGLYR